MEVLPIAATANVKGLLLAPHNVGGGISTAAALHLAAMFPNCIIVEHFNDFADAHLKDAVSPYPQVDGRGIVMDPGLNMFRNANWSKRGQ